MTAVPPQPVTAGPGQPYGERQAQTQAQRQIPLPNQAAATQQAVSRGTTGTPTPQAAAPAAPPDLQALAQAAPGPPEGGMLAAYADPSRPLTSGLPFGPGAGPVVTEVGLEHFYATLAAATGDNFWLDLASRARAV